MLCDTLLLKTKILFILKLSLSTEVFNLLCFLRIFNNSAFHVFLPAICTYIYTHFLSLNSVLIIVFSIIYLYLSSQMIIVINSNYPMRKNNILYHISMTLIAICNPLRRFIIMQCLSLYLLISVKSRHLFL